MQRSKLRGYHRLGMEQGNTAKKRDWDYASMGLISAPQTMHRWASSCSQLGQTPTRGRRPEGISLHGLARSVLLIVLTT